MLQRLEVQLSPGLIVENQIVATLWLIPVPILLTPARLRRGSERRESLGATAGSYRIRAPIRWMSRELHAE